MSLEQLESAKALALQDLSLFPPILDQILAISTGSDLHLTRWCVLFLRDCFHGKQVPFELRYQQSPKLLDSLLKCLTVKDTVVVSAIIDITTAVYDLVFKYTIDYPGDTETWSKMTLLKSEILGRFETADPLLPLNRDADLSRSIPVKVSTLKFYGKLLTVHLPLIRDPRVKENNPQYDLDFSIAMVPPNHPVLWNTDGEGENLLDNLFEMLSDELIQTTPIFTVFCSVLVQVLRKRPKYIFGRIFNLILGYDSVLQRPPVYETDMLKVKMVQRYNDRFNKILISFLLNRNFVKDAGLKQKLDKKFKVLVERQRVKIDQYSRVEPIAHLAKKYQGNEFYNNSIVPKDNTYKSLFTLLQDSNALAQFDMSTLPLHVLVDMITTSLTTIDTSTLIRGLTVVADRYTFEVAKSLTGQTNAVTPHQQQQNQAVAESADSDYEPDFDDAEPYQLPPPKTLTISEKKQQMSKIVENFIRLSSDQNHNHNNAGGADDSQKKDFENWLLIRLITRGLKDETLVDVVRNCIFDHFVQDMRNRIDIVISWLNEEWYNEHLQDPAGSFPNYTSWTSKVLDNFLPFLESSDRKILIRFVSEVPLIDLGMVMKLKSLCSDPIRYKLGFQTLQYLIMFKPPAKEHCIILLETMYEQSSDDVKEQCLGYLKKYSPEKYH
ncbi:unnamed protein product [Kuraishia capsulata CBS 1993]|uniref:Symplekin/Pta1 N-terminal domain-containing protein n=1 Tax=Kuraishia capsulata CBS 1993 TaxID=1382522 RepID=W6MPI5_9ASCO|nr:uncharacterized protein KUCA_T00004534001 [Kuraishia capsulata CBS 1993]CDK28551.1 unnamed protein product [Kuraishia capsulata CBS 1993]